MGRILLLLSVLTLIPSVSFGQSDTAAIISPLGYNASLDSSGTVTFHCSVTGAQLLAWTVDGQQSDGNLIRNRGIQTSTTDPDDGSPGFFESNLTIPTTFVNDNSSVQCFAIILTGPGNTNSSLIAILQIQGLLEEPPNLVITDLNATHRRLSWDPPFTLDITDQDPDIIAYTVCNNITGSCENTTETQFIFPNLAVHIEFSVTAINIVGEGNTSTIVHEACEPATELEVMGITNVSVTVSFDGANSLTNVKIRFLQESTCFHIHMVETVANSSGIPIMHGPLIPEVIYQDSMAHVIVTLDSNLEENECHSATIFFVYEGGNTSLDSGINFATFDVQSVEVAVEPGAIVVTLTFAAGSQALGFHLLIIPLSGDTTRNVSRNVTVEQTGSSPTLLEHRERGLDTGSYLVQIFDWESDGAIDFDNMVHFARVTVTVPTTSVTPTSTTVTMITDTFSGTTSTTPTPPPITPSTGGVPPGGSDDMTAAIAGAVIGGLIIVVLVILIIVVGWWVCRSRSGKKKADQRNHQYAALNRVTTDGGTGTGTQLPLVLPPLPPPPPYSLPGEDEPPDPMYEKAPLSRQGTPKRSRAFGHDSTDAGPRPLEEQHQPQPQLREMEPIAPAMMVGESSQKTDPQYATIQDSHLSKKHARSNGVTPQQQASTPQHQYEEPILPPSHLLLPSEDNTGSQRDSSVPPPIPQQHFTEEELKELNLSPTHPSPPSPGLQNLPASFPEDGPPQNLEERDLSPAPLVPPQKFWEDIISPPPEVPPQDFEDMLGGPPHEVPQEHLDELDELMENLNEYAAASASTSRDTLTDKPVPHAYGKVKHASLEDLTQDPSNLSQSQRALRCHTYEEVPEILKQKSQSTSALDTQHHEQTTQQEQPTQHHGEQSASDGDVSSLPQEQMASDGDASFQPQQQPAAKPFSPYVELDDFLRFSNPPPYDETSVPYSDVHLQVPSAADHTYANVSQHQVPKAEHTYANVSQGQGAAATNRSRYVELDHVSLQISEDPPQDKSAVLYSLLHIQNQPPIPEKKSKR